MANPFGGSDEALALNTGHGSYGSLVLCIVPRTTTKFREVVNSADVTTGETGTYDADGFWFGASSTRVASIYTIPTPFAAGSAHTVIYGLKRTGSSVTDAAYVGLYKDGGTTVRSLSSLGNSSPPDQIYPQIRDADFDSGLSSFSTVTSSTNAFGGTHAHNGSNAQKFFTRFSSTNDATQSTSATTLDTDSSANLDRAGVYATSRWGFQYLFVYSAYLDDSVIEAIIDDPTTVVSAASSDVTVGASGSAATSGIGTQAPGTSIGL